MQPPNRRPHRFMRGGPPGFRPMPLSGGFMPLGHRGGPSNFRPPLMPPRYPSQPNNSNCGTNHYAYSPRRPHAPPVGNAANSGGVRPLSASSGGAVLPSPFAVGGSMSSSSGPPKAEKSMGLESVNNSTFDMFLCELFQSPQSVQPSATETGTDTEEQDKENKACQVIMKKYQEITISSQMQNLLSSIVAKIQGVIEALIVNPELCPSIIIDEMKIVGNYKANTVLQALPEADVVLLLKTLPTKVAVEALKVHCIDEVRKMIQQNADEKYNTVVHCEGTTSGFSVTLVKQNVLVANVNISVCHANFLNHDPLIHVDRQEQEKALQSIRQSMWVEEHANNVSIRVLVRILSDMTLHFQWFDPLSDWIIFVLAHHCIADTGDGTPLSIAAAVRRVFQLLAGGLFTPGSVGLVDPCTGFPMHRNMTLAEQDRVCLTAQALLRILAHSDVATLLSSKITQEALVSSPQVLGGVVVKPSLGVSHAAPLSDVSDEDEMPEDNNSGAVGQVEKTMERPQVA